MYILNIRLNTVLLTICVYILSVLDVVLSPVNVTALNSQTALTDGLLHLRCSITVKYTADNVAFIWEANGQEIYSDTVNNADNGTFTHLYNATELTQADDNTEYTCRVVINGNLSLTEYGTYQLNLSEKIKSECIAKTIHFKPLRWGFLIIPYKGSYWLVKYLAIFSKLLQIDV